MSKTAHKIFLAILIVIVVATFVTISYKGISYYRTSLEVRYFHSLNDILKPSGIWGHGFGIFGSLFMLIGVATYMMRKRFRSLSRLGLLKHWLEFHIFLCTLGPMLVLFHTSFKFGGIVAVSFWCMVAVFLSGVIGRFIYIQIPRTIEGRELSLSEVHSMKNDIAALIKNSYRLDDESINVIKTSISRKPELYHKNIFIRYFRKYVDDYKTIRTVKQTLKKNKLSKVEEQKVFALVKDDISLNRKIMMLVTMQNLFKYWHVAHLPFAVMMLIIMIIHVGVTIVFGYKWIF